MFKTTAIDTLKQDKKCQACWYIIMSTMSGSTTINYCPVCSNNNISLIPLANGDVYDMNIRSKGGLELRFSKANKL